MLNKSEVMQISRALFDVEPADAAQVCVTFLAFMVDRGTDVAMKELILLNILGAFATVLETDGINWRRVFQEAIVDDRRDNVTEH